LIVPRNDNSPTRRLALTHYRVWTEGDDMGTGLGHLLDHLQQAGGGLTDGQLLGRFVAARDEASFAALVRRHGAMVLGVCRRVLRDFHDAEDAFQATFLVLARRAASVVKRESVGCWLHGVAYRTALEARDLTGRRRARERQVTDMPHPEVAPAEAQDWRPLLDRELDRLPEKYRTAVVLCDLEGQPRKEAARQLGIPEGTLSSRLAAAHKMLARRLAGCGLALSGGALAAALTQGTVSAQMSAALVSSTARAAALVAAGQLAAASGPAVVLMKGVMKAMLLKKLRLVVGAVVVLAALGMGGVAYQAGGFSATVQAAPPEKPVNELEALRKENELLKLNLQVVLEKVRAQETELHAARKELAAKDEVTKGLQMSLLLQRNQVNTNLIYTNGISTSLTPYMRSNLTTPWLNSANANGLVLNDVLSYQLVNPQDPVSDATKEAESAIKALREAKDKEGKRKAAEALDKAMKRLKEGLK
jgi:RNA polymerase sigma factor (sigma-70 family)